MKNLEKMSVAEYLELVQKDAIDTATGGQLSAEDATAFISEVVDQSEFMQLQTIRRGIRAGTANIDTIGLASRVLLAATEATAPGSTVETSISRRTMTLVEVILPYDVTDNFMEENIEGEDVQATLNTAFAQAFSNDLCDMSVNGDEDSGTAFLAINNGYIDLFLSDADVHDFDNAGSTDFIGTVFPGMLAALPSKWKRNRAALAFIVSPEDYEDYLDEVAARATPAGDNALLNAVDIRFKGIPVREHPYVPEGTQILTPTANLYIGFGRDITWELQRQARKRLTEYTITAKVDFEYAIGDAVVLSQDLT